MRVVGEISHPACKISIFAWNQKYLVKIETGRCEQTFKIDQLDVQGDDDLRKRISGEFIDRAVRRMESMHEDLGLLFVD